MSSWKVETRAHRERAQPRGRARLGLLEKHADYKKRADAHHSKAARLRSMKLKAEMRNPDEFYFGMVKSQTSGGVHKLSADTGALDKDTLKLLKTQDIGYVKFKAQAEAKKIERLKAQLHGIAGPAAAGGSGESGHDQGSGRHMVFVDGAEDVAKFKTHKFFDTVPEQVSRKHNRQLKSTVKQAAREAAEEETAMEREELVAVKKAERKARKRARRELDAKYRELAERSDRLGKLRRTAEHFAAKRATLDKGRRVKVADAAEGRPAVFKWKPQRKR